MDRYAARYSGAIRMQGHRVEIIADLELLVFAMHYFRTHCVGLGNF